MKKITLSDVFFSKVFMFLYFSIVLLSDCYIYFNSYINKTILFTGLVLNIFTIVIYLLEGKYSKWNIVLLIYGCWGAITSYLGNYSNIEDFLFMFSKIAGISIYLDMALKKNSEKTLKTLNVVFYGLLIINFFSIILYPDGLYQDGLYSNNWFFLYDNMHIFMYFPALLINIVVGKYTKKIRLNLILEFIIVTFGIFYCFSANSVVAYSIFLIYLLLRRVINNLKVFNSKNYFKAYIIAFFSIVVLKIQEVFRWFIVEILGKDLTFSSRTILWERIAEFIKKSPLLGYGAESTKIFSEKMGSANFTHAHNTIFNIIYKYGIIGAILHIVLLIIPINKLYEFKDKEISKLIGIVILCILIMCIFEAREEKIGFYIILVLAVNIKSIIESIKEKKGIEIC